jgi:hypothetical protein
VAVRPGDSSLLNLSVQNTGDTVDTYLLEVLGVDPGWVFLEGMPQFSLLPGKQTEVRLTIQPPPTSASKAGLYKVGLRVTRTNDPTRQGQPTMYTQAATIAPSQLVQNTISLDLTVLPVLDFNVEVTPRYMDSRRNRKAQLKITNTGNSDILFNVVANDPADALNYRYPAQVGVHAGQTELVPFESAPRQGKLIGGPVNHDFQVTIQPAQIPVAGGRGLTTPSGGTPLSSMGASMGAMPKTISGRYTFKPPIPPWLIPTLGSLLLLLVAGAVALFAIISGNRQKEIDATKTAEANATAVSQNQATQTALADSQSLTLGAAQNAQTVQAVNAAATQTASKASFDATSTAQAEQGANQLTVAAQQALATQTGLAQQAQLTNAAATINALQSKTPQVTTTNPPTTPGGGAVTTPAPSLKPITDKLKGTKGLAVDATGQFAYLAQDGDKNLVQINLQNPAAAPVVLRSGLKNPTGLIVKGDFLYFLDAGEKTVPNSGTLSSYNVKTKALKVLSSGLQEPSSISEAAAFSRTANSFIITLSGSNNIYLISVDNDTVVSGSVKTLALSGVSRPVAATRAERVSAGTGTAYLVVTEGAQLYRVIVNAERTAATPFRVNLTNTGASRPAVLSAPLLLDNIPGTNDYIVAEQKLPGVSRIRLVADGSSGTIETTISTGNDPATGVLINEKKELFFSTQAALYKIQLT